MLNAKNHPENQPSHKCGPKCKAVTFSTPYGAVVYFPETKAGLTFMVTNEGERRVRGAEKRILLTMLKTIEEARRRPLPILAQN